MSVFDERLQKLFVALRVLGDLVVAIVDVNS